MVARIVWLAVAAGLLAAAHFTVWPARTYRTWWVALFATELGHVWAVGSLALAAGAARGLRAEAAGGGGRVWAGATVLLALVAAGFFARPVWSAWRMSGAVERDLTATFGPEREAGRALWSWRRLARWPMAVERGAVETHDANGRALDFYQARGDVPYNPMGYIAGKAPAGGAGGAPCVVLVHGGGGGGGG
jgi:hypothetical protein